MVPQPENWSGVPTVGHPYINSNVDGMWLGSPCNNRGAPHAKWVVPAKCKNPADFTYITTKSHLEPADYVQIYYRPALFLHLCYFRDYLFIFPRIIPVFYQEY